MHILGFGKEKKAERPPRSAVDQGVPTLPNFSSHHLSLVPSPKCQGPLSRGVVERTPSRIHPTRSIFSRKTKIKMSLGLHIVGLNNL